MELEYETSSPKALLKIDPVKIEDEADYKCEITYWEVREDCETVHIIKLKTLGKYITSLQYSYAPEINLKHDSSSN